LTRQGGSAGQVLVAIPRGGLGDPAMPRDPDEDAAGHGVEDRVPRRLGRVGTELRTPHAAAVR